MIQKLLDAVKGKDVLLASQMIILISAIIGFGWYSIVTKRPLDGIALIVGALVTNYNTLVNFRWGSSKGSKDKDKNINNNNTPQP
ncbi:hypothetical protein CJD36_019885 [Flavipsychrobacter stenotrophus]|uniref:Uncharacterized protein n=1 Tax=Flavipsychrobacter stenotrophus TaxID=2077091 RepID=A0A2S7SRG1_9BACT|nr:hypothetical protein [Flavipsychrobacter stenotrophus]PQJ09502.1 hypothetical protein CJD36_019885 [Flavipsychrobacter stenotrophus]